MKLMRIWSFHLFRLEWRKTLLARVPIVNISFLSTFWCIDGVWNFFHWLNSIRCFKKFIRFFQFVCRKSATANHLINHNTIEVALFVSFSYFFIFPCFPLVILLTEIQYNVLVHVCCTCSWQFHCFFPFTFTLYSLRASTFLFSLFRFCHLIWEGWRERGMCSRVGMELTTFFLLPVHSLIGFVEKMFVYCRFILFDYYYYYCQVPSAEFDYYYYCGRARCQR